MRKRFVDDKRSKTIFEFFGCLFHGCTCAYTCDNDQNPFFLKTVIELISEVTKRLDYFSKRAFNVEFIWECDFKRQLTANAEKKFFVDARMKY